MPPDLHPFAAPQPSGGLYALPELRFGYGDLEPAIDEETLRLHHDEHHRTHVENLNAVLAQHPDWLGLTIEDLLRRLPELPEELRDTVRDEGGGHANHQFFWKILSPSGAGAPKGALAEAIKHDFGSFETFKATFGEAAVNHFGSGWVFLVARPRDGFRLEILTLPDQNSVLGLTEPAPGLLICDLWEHAYYLKHQNRRAEWIEDFWRVVDWDVVGHRLQGIREGREQL